METTFFHKNLSKKEEGIFAEYVTSKLEGIENLLTSFEDDEAILRISIEKFDKHDAYDVELRLDIQTKSLIAKETSHHISKAVDLAKDRLLAQIKKHISQMRDKRQHKAIKENEKAGKFHEIKVEDHF